MRSLFSLLLILGGLFAAAVMVWMLIPPGGRDVAYHPLPPAKPAAEGRGERERLDRAVEERPSGLEPIPSIPGPEARLRKEPVLPRREHGGMRGGLWIRLTTSRGSALPSAKDLCFRIYFQDVLAPLVPHPEVRPGEYALEDLLPGAYRVRAYTVQGGGLEGEVSCRVEPGETLSVRLALERPLPLRLKVQDGDTGAPVAGARVQWSGSNQSGLTDERGWFVSSLSLVPVAEQCALVTHPDYFSLRFDPRDPEACGAEPAGRWKTDFRIPLRTRKGPLSLSGIIQDEKGRPLKRWVLHLHPLNAEREGKGSFLSCLTDRTGRFHLENLPPGEYLLSGTLRLMALRPGRPPPPLFEEPVRLDPGEAPQERIITVTRKRVPFHGWVLHTDPVQPAAGVGVTCRGDVDPNRFLDDRPPFFDPMVTDGQGAFRSRRSFLPEDLFRLIVDGAVVLVAPGGETLPYRYARTADDLVRLQEDLLLDRPVTLWFIDHWDLILEGRVQDSTGEPLSRRMISVRSPTRLVQGERRSSTDMEGRFRVDGLFPGIWSLRIFLPRGPVREETVVLHRDPPHAPLVITIPEHGKIEGLVKARQFPRRMWVHAEGPGYATARVPVGTLGVFEFQYLPPGPARVVLEYSGTATRAYGPLYRDAREVVVAPGKTVSVSFDL